MLIKKMALKSIFDEELMELLRFEVDIKNVMEEWSTGYQIVAC